MSVLLILAAVWVLAALFSLALCAVAGRADQRIDGWRDHHA